MNTRPLELQFLGSGDAFGSGGRLQSCILATSGHGTFLIDCGASCLIGMNRYGVDPNSIRMILVSHLHGDHFGGIPFFIKASQHVGKRSEPLLILGPPGIKELLAQATEAMFPSGSRKVQTNFPIEFMEFRDGVCEHIDDVTVTPYRNVHPQVDVSFSLRIECDGKTIAYSGDTEWTDSLLQAARGADLFIAESYYYEKKVKGHMDFKTLKSNFIKTSAKKLIITHMSDDMLSMLDSVDCEYAHDGKKVIL